MDPLSFCTAITKYDVETVRLALETAGSNQIPGLVPGFEQACSEGQTDIAIVMLDFMYKKGYHRSILAGFCSACTYAYLAIAEAVVARYVRVPAYHADLCFEAIRITICYHDVDVLGGILGNRSVWRIEAMNYAQVDELKSMAARKSLKAVELLSTRYDVFSRINVLQGQGKNILHAIRDGRWHEWNAMLRLDEQIQLESLKQDELASRPQGKSIAPICKESGCTVLRALIKSPDELLNPHWPTRESIGARSIEQLLRVRGCRLVRGELDLLQLLRTWPQFHRIKQRDNWERLVRLLIGLRISEGGFALGPAGLHGILCQAVSAPRPHCILQVLLGLQGERRIDVSRNDWLVVRNVLKFSGSLLVAAVLHSGVDRVPPESVYDECTAGHAGRKPYLYWLHYPHKKPRVRRVLQWRQALCAHRDASLLGRCCGEGRPLELGKRLRLGKLACSAGRLVELDAMAREGGYDECREALHGLLSHEPHDKPVKRGIS